ncbi:MAG: ParA family protein [Bacteroidales bacterium]|jgi:chromosome partitioning protein|nr:ParA family protein [Bacteroidales bacterium]MBR5650831.1 ParA family protein [Bacteroidales bacterium]MBR5720741.1 ParA family protein [Bacteroidales bacterium]
MAKIIAVSNQKGGVGKTTTVLNLGSSLAVLEYKTLVIDADPQANATTGLGLDARTITKSIYECIIEDIQPQDAIVHTEIPLFDIIPAHIDLVGAEIELIDLEDREFKMKKVINKIKDQYDFILIDCSPSLGLITVNALTAADSVIIPVQSEFYALEGLGKLLNTIKIIQNRLNRDLTIEGILVTMYDKRELLRRNVLEELKTHFKDIVFSTIINRNTKLGEAPSFGKPVILHDANSTGAINYLNLAREILKKNNMLRDAEEESKK